MKSKTIRVSNIARRQTPTTWLALFINHLKTTTFSSCKQLESDISQSIVRCVFELNKQTVNADFPDLKKDDFVDHRGVCRIEFETADDKEIVLERLGNDFLLIGCPYSQRSKCREWVSADVEAEGKRRRFEEQEIDIAGARNVLDEMNKNKKWVPRERVIDGEHNVEVVVVLNDDDDATKTTTTTTTNNIEDMIEQRRVRAEKIAEEKMIERKNERERAENEKKELIDATLFAAEEMNSMKKRRLGGGSQKFPKKQRVCDGLKSSSSSSSKPVMGKIFGGLIRSPM